MGKVAYSTVEYSTCGDVMRCDAMIWWGKDR